MTVNSLSRIVVAMIVAATPAAVSAGPDQEITIFAMRHVGDHYVIDVPYRDLDLSRPAEVGILKDRVAAAASQGCSTNLYYPPLTDNERRGCVEDAVGGTYVPLKRAERRAWEIAQTGSSSIPPVAIAMRVGF